MRPVLSLEEIGLAGFTTSPFLDSELQQRLLQEFEALGLEKQHGFVATCNDLSRPAAAALDARIKELLAPRIAEHLPGHEPFLAGFLSKGAGVGARLDLHQDLSYTDERVSRSIILWIPLVDLDRSSGALEVVPGSHRWTRGCRPGAEQPLPTDALRAELAELAVSLHVPPGHVVAYDPALVHGSPPNTSRWTRPAVGVALAERGAPLIHAHRQPDGHVTFHRVDAAYYTTQTLFETPQGYPSSPTWSDPVTTDDLRAALRAIAP